MKLQVTKIKICQIKVYPIWKGSVAMYSINDNFLWRVVIYDRNKVKWYILNTPIFLFLYKIKWSQYISKPYKLWNIVTLSQDVQLCILFEYL